MPTITTKRLSLELRYVFGVLNLALFGARLPPCEFFFERRDDVVGMFRSRRFHGRDQIGFNPDFLSRPLIDTLSTCAHELVHLWQYERGKITTVGFHNREWADRMISIGLQPSDTGAPGGNEVGEDMTHYIIAGGRFDCIARKLIASGFRLHGIPS